MSIWLRLFAMLIAAVVIVICDISPWHSVNRPKYYAVMPIEVRTMALMAADVRCLINERYRGFRSYQWQLLTDASRHQP